MKKIHVLTKRPGSIPRSVWVSDTLENLQRQVGGYIETVMLDEDLVVICNEEGRLRNLPYNCEVEGIQFYGDIIIAGVQDEEFADLPMNYQKAKICFPDLWEVET